MLLQGIFKSIIVSVLAQARLAATEFRLYLAGKLNLNFCTQQCGATTRTLRRPYPGSMTSHVQGVRIGVPLEMIKMVRMMRGAGVWRVPDAMGTGGALRAQVGKAQRTLVNWSGVAFKVQPFFSFTTQTGLDQQAGENTQISAAVSPLTQGKTRGATGGRGQAAAASRTRGTVCPSGAWRMPTRKRGPSIHRGPSCLSR